MRSVLLIIIGCAVFGNLMAIDPPNLIWELGYSTGGKMDSLNWVEALVPGSVQLDVARAEGYGTYYFADNWKDYLWMEDQEFVYRTRFTKPELEVGQRLIFNSLGIDYEFEISLNGEILVHQEGMFTPVRIDLTDQLEDQNELQVKILPIPKMHMEPADRSQAAASVKPTVSYGWDWHPRLVPMGIWDDTYLEILPGSHVEELTVQYTLNEELSKAEILVEVTGRELVGCILTWKIFDTADKMIDAGHFAPRDNKGKLEMILKNPRLWWPHDHGDPYLYSYSLELADRYGNLLQTMHGNLGFRKVRLVMNEGAWSEPRGFPKTRSVAPIQLEINNRRIFCKGTNWVNPEIFPGMITRERYGALIDLAVEANFNMFRIWGGGIVNKE